MQTVSRRHQFLRGRRAHHHVRVGIEGDHDRLAAVVTRIANDRVDQFAMPPMHAVEHADGDRRGAQARAIIKRIGGNDAASSDSPAKKIRESSWEASIIEHRRSPAERHAP